MRYNVVNVFSEIILTLKLYTVWPAMANVLEITSKITKKLLTFTSRLLMQALYGYFPTVRMDVPRTDTRPRTASVLHELTSQRVEPLHTNHILQTDIVRIIRIHQFRIHPVYIRIQPVYVRIQPVYVWI